METTTTQTETLEVTLPTGSRPVTITEELISDLAQNGLLNLYEQLGKTCTELSWTVSAAQRAVSLANDVPPITEPGDAAADLFLDRLLSDVTDQLPTLAYTAEYDHCDAYAIALFGKQAVTDFRSSNVGTEDAVDAVRGTAELAFRIAAVFFATPPDSGARNLLLAAAMVAQDNS